MLEKEIGIHSFCENVCELHTNTPRIEEKAKLDGMVLALLML